MTAPRGMGAPGTGGWGRTGIRRPAFTLVPASELPHFAAWQRVASGLPSGHILLVVPRHNQRLDGRMAALVAGCAAAGHPATILPTAPAPWRCRRPRR